MKYFKEEIKSSMDEFRAEIKDFRGDIKDFKSEVKSEMKNLSAEIKEEIQSIKKEQARHDKQYQSSNGHPWVVCKLTLHELIDDIYGCMHGMCDHKFINYFQLQEWL